jgi:uncharacterized membrane protein
MKKKASKETLDAMNKDINNWKGPVYFNRNDYRLVVQKRHPALGWTFNFANPYVYLILTAFILLIIAAKYLF